VGFNSEWCVLWVFGVACFEGGVGVGIAGCGSCLFVLIGLFSVLGVAVIIYCCLLGQDAVQCWVVLLVWCWFAMIGI